MTNVNVLCRDLLVGEDEKWKPKTFAFASVEFGEEDGGEDLAADFVWKVRKVGHRACVFDVIG